MDMRIEFGKDHYNPDILIVADRGFILGKISFSKMDQKHIYTQTDRFLGLTSEQLRAIADKLDLLDGLKLATTEKTDRKS